jgi:hypothetical protein
MSTQPVEPSITDATVILNLEFGRVCNRRKLKSDTEAITTDIDRNSLHLGVDLFDAPELRACQTFQNRLKAQVQTYTVPSFFRGGMYLVKLEAVETVNKLIEQAKIDFIPLVEEFAAVVDQRRDERREHLKQAFDPSAYPSREQVLGVYRIEHRWLSMSTPTSLKKISIAIFEREREKAEETLKAATENITAMLAAEAKSVGDHLVERLTPGDDGKQKIIKRASIDNITEYLNSFALRNIGTSDELQAQVERMRGLITGLDVKDLRLNDQLRSDVATSFAEISQALDRLIVNKPARYMARGDE